MKTISKPSKNILSLIKDANPADDVSLRQSRFCIEKKVPEGTLLYNTLTGEMILLDKNEQPADLLFEHGFLVPENSDETAVCDNTRSVLSFFHGASASGLKTFTILTTSDCNARCFYCYEMGCEKMTMTEDTAVQIVRYILRNAADEPLRLRWFGGEPLFNSAAIDSICTKLKEAGKSFTSHMVSNGYLFDEERIRKAGELWNLKQVQITLDGTEDVYNRRKAYINDRNGAFRRVTDNIGLLQKAGIQVKIRLNADTDNLEDLNALLSFLDRRYPDKNGLRVYTAPIFSEYILQDAERMKKLYDGLNTLEERLEQLGLNNGVSLPKGLRINSCIADDETSVVILPDGRLHSCEHFNQNSTFGSVSENTGRSADLPYWRKTYSRLPECDTCPLYPQCIRLLHCPDINGTCTPEMRDYRIRRIVSSMTAVYESFCQNTENRKI